MAQQNQNQPRQDYWQNHIKQWKRSGLSQVLYCRKHKISKNTLGYWIKKQIKGTPKSPEFVQLPVKIMTSTSLEIIINNRFKILISVGFDVQLLKDTIKILEQLS